MKHVSAAALLMVLAAVPALAQEAQQPPRAPRTLRGAPEGPRPSVAPAYDANAPETQQRLQQLLQQYPPSLGRVMALDPTLLTNQTYLETYPALSQFLQQHPEIAHNPGYPTLCHLAFLVCEFELEYFHLKFEL